MKLKILLSSLIFTLSGAKLLIVTTAYDNPYLLEAQARTFRKYILEDFDYLVCNDADNKKNFIDIKNVCSKLNLIHFPIPNKEAHNNYFKHGCWKDAFNLDKTNPRRAAFRHGQALQYMYENIGHKHSDLLMIIDVDIFLIKEISINKLMDNSDIYCHSFMNNEKKWLFNSQPRGGYYGKTFSMELMIINLKNIDKKELLNFNAGFIGSQYVDSGALIALYADSSNIKIKQQSRVNFTEADLNQFPNYKHHLNTIKDINFEKYKSSCPCIIEDCFIDYKNATNHNNTPESIINKKKRAFKSLIDQICEN